MKFSRATRLTALLAAPLLLAADTVKLDNGDQLTGTVTHIRDGVLTLETAYAGTLSIKQENIAGIVTNTPAAIAVQVAVETDAAPPPVAAPAKKPAPWSYSAAAEARHTSGNSHDTTASIRLEANQIDPDLWTLKLYTGVEYNKADGNVTEHKVQGGADADFFTSKLTGVYAREELLTDRANDIRLRSTFGAGGEYFLHKKPTENGLDMLRLRAGLGHRYEKHRDADASSDSAMTVDLGLRLNKELAENITWTTELTYAPAIDNFNNYLATHDSRCEFNLVKKWRVSYELGVQHAYNSRPAEGNVYLDTTYYTRLKKTW